jgi:hypothetical protein
VGKTKSNVQPFGYLAQRAQYLGDLLNILVKPPNLPL